LPRGKIVISIFIYINEEMGIVTENLIRIKIYKEFAEELSFVNRAEKIVRKPKEIGSAFPLFSFL